MADRFWNLLARRYDRQSHAEEGYGKAVERFAQYLRPEHTVLDYACATGVVAFKIADRVARVHAIDTSARMIELGRARAREAGANNVRFECRSLFDDDLERGAYDVILAFNILHLLDDTGAAVTRAAELLRPEGILVSSTPCLGDAGFFMRTLPPLISKLGILSYLRKLGSADVRAMQIDSGFEILQHDVRDEAIPICFVVARRS